MKTYITSKQAFKAGCFVHCALLAFNGCQFTVQIYLHNSCAIVTYVSRLDICGRLFQSMFTNASRELFLATRHRVYFRSITVVVPTVSSGRSSCTITKPSIPHTCLFTAS